MTEQDVKLLLVDLCARLPYGVKIQSVKEPDTAFRLCAVDIESKEIKFFKYESKALTILDIGKLIRYDKICYKPYLRPMSLMTEEESEEFSNMEIVGYSNYDWLNAHHFDFRNLIEKGLAIEVTEENNPYERRD